MNNKLINYQKKTSLSIISFTEKMKKKNGNLFRYRADPDPDPLFPEADLWIRIKISGSETLQCSYCKKSPSNWFMLGTLLKQDRFPQQLLNVGKNRQYRLHGLNIFSNYIFAYFKSMK